tara:strand:- start:47 stop:241 length:195 start_codon:yes stop_codon:yes gene_type:complete
MKPNDIGPYIESLKNSVSKILPKKNIENAMVDISNYFLSRWVIDNNFLLSKSDINNIVKKYIND